MNDHPPETDPAPRRDRRHRRLLVGVATVGVLAGTIGGYLVGRNGRTETVALQPGDEAATETGGAEDGGGPPIADSGGPLGGDAPMGASLPSEFVTARDLGDGVRLRVWRQRYSPSMAPVASPGTPAQCRSVGTVLVGLSDARMVATTGAPLPPEEAGATTSLFVAGNGGPQAFAVVVVTGIGSARVRASFPTGEDTMRAVDGLAALAARIDADDLDRLDQVRVSIDGGAPREVDAAQIYDATDGRARYERLVDCTPALPPPGGQPEDPTAARAEVVTAWSTVVDGATPVDAKLGRIDDPSGIEDAFASARANFPAAADGAAFRLVDLVFTAPDRASVKYDVEVPEGSAAAQLVRGLVGEARLVDGTWKVTRDSACRLLGMAGGGCPTTGAAATTDVSAPG